MKKFIPFIFIAITAGLIGAKIAIAGESTNAVPAVQSQQLN